MMKKDGCMCVFFVKTENEWNEKKTEQKTWFFRFRFPDGSTHLSGREEIETKLALMYVLWTNTNNNDATVIIMISFFPMLHSLSLSLSLLLFLDLFCLYYNATSTPAGTLAQRLVKFYDKSSISHLGASFPMCIHAQRDENITMETKKDT